MKFCVLSTRGRWCALIGRGRNAEYGKKCENIKPLHFKCLFLIIYLLYMSSDLPLDWSEEGVRNMILTVDHG